MNEVRVRVGNPYELDWEESERLPASPLLLPRRSFDVLCGFEVAPPLIMEQSLVARTQTAKRTEGIIRFYFRADSTREYLISFARLALYSIVCVAAAAVSLFLIAHKEYSYLAASVLAFVGFAVLALIRLSIHVQEHRRLADNNIRRAA
jgi:hypothetical protein